MQKKLITVVVVLVVLWAAISWISPINEAACSALPNSVMDALFIKCSLAGRLGL